MSSKEETAKLINAINYISQKNNDVSVEDRRDILKIIMSSGVSNDQIHTKGNGTEIKYKNIPVDCIYRIQSFIEQRISEKIEKLKSMSNE